jgi:hypothetical protein
VRPDVDPISGVTVEYAFGEYAWLMMSAFLMLSVGSFALLLGLLRTLALPARSMTGLTLLGVWALALVIAGIVPFDPRAEPQTTAEAIALVNGPVHVIALVVGATLVSRRFSHDDVWRDHRGFALGLAVAMLAAFLVVGAMLAMDAPIVGLAQRVFVVITIVWLLAAALRLAGWTGRSDV